MDVIAVLVSKGGIAIMFLKYIRTFLVFAVAAATEVRSVMAAIEVHAGTLKSALGTKMSGSRRTTRGLELRPEKAAITLSG